MKKIYTDKDIEELARNGIKSLQITDDVVLTDLAYEKARRLGLELVADREDAPPAAPVRPYLSDMKPQLPKPKVDSVSQATSTPQRTLTPNPSPSTERGILLEKRIREKVAARLGNQVDATLLDTIIKRTLKITGMK